MRVRLIALFCLALCTCVGQDATTDDYPDNEPLHLTMNVENGTKIELSDGSMYEIRKEDRLYTSLWITPFPVEVAPSGNEDYPYVITNLNTERSVLAKQISQKQLFKKKQKAEPIKPEPLEKKK